jgi:hypothetical protein
MGRTPTEKERVSPDIFQNVQRSITSPAGTSIAYRWNRHGILELKDIFDGEELMLASSQKPFIEPTGMIAFEIAGVSRGDGTTTQPLIHTTPRDNASGTRKTYSFTTESFRVSETDALLHFGGAVYGKDLAIPHSLLALSKEPLAKVSLIDNVSLEQVAELWTVPFSDLRSVLSGTFGSYRNIQLNLDACKGKEVFLKVEMIGSSRGIQPLLVDDYFIVKKLSDQHPDDSRSVEEGLTESQELPRGFALHQCYPNPFNPATTIAFDLPEPCYVTLNIYNALGQEIHKPVSEWRDAGGHQVTVDLTRFPSGIYVYQMEAGSFKDTKRMIMVK